MGHVAVDSHDGIAIVRIDRPPANALDPDLVEELRVVAEDVERTAPDAVVLTGRNRFFSAGLDLNLVPALDEDSRRDMVMGVNRMAAAWYALSRPVVCAVSGHAIAGGLVLALCGDYRVGSRVGKLGLTEVRVGVAYPAGALTVVRAALSPPAVRVLVLRAHLVEPEEALTLGLLDELAPPADVLERGLAMAVELGGLPGDTYATVKRQLRGETIAELQRIAGGAGDPLNDSWLSRDVGAAASGALGQSS
jgi:enoyl-CoA hydratase